jgi:hypothetical protein
MIRIKDGYLICEFKSAHNLMHYIFIIDMISFAFIT